MFNVLAAKVLDVENACLHPNFNNGDGWGVVYGTESVSGNVLSNTGIGVGNAPLSDYVTEVPSDPSAKWFIFFRARVTNAVCEKLRIGTDGSSGGADNIRDIITSPLQDKWYNVCVITTEPADASGYFRFYIRHQYADAATANGKVMEVEGSPARGGGVWAIKMDGHMKNYTENQMYKLVKHFSQKEYFDNAVVNGNFALDSNGDGLADGFVVTGTLASKAVSNNVQSFTAQAQNGGVECTPTANNNDIIYASCIVKTSTNLVGLRVAGAVASYTELHPGNGKYVMLSLRRTATGGTIYTKVFDYGISGFDNVDMKQFVFYNLTTKYGAGNEPSQAWCDENLATHVNY